MRVGVFISHSWKYSDHYDTLSDWIFGESWHVDGNPVEFLDFSVPKDNPIHFAPNETALQQAIFQRIKLSSVVVIPTGMYATHSKWIGKEIAGSKYHLKPILAVNPWGQEKKSSVVQQAAKDSCGWNKKSVAQAVWNLSQT